MTAATATAEKRLPKTRRESALGMTLRRLAKNKLALTGGVIFVLLCLAALFDIVSTSDSAIRKPHFW